MNDDKKRQDSLRSPQPAWALARCLALLVVGLTAVTSTAIHSSTPEESSRNQYLGIGEWREGRDCPSMELIWKPGAGDYWESFFKARNGTTTKLGQGIAIFSPDCRSFWFVSLDRQDVISIFETTNGRKASEIVGRYPAWSPDSQSILVSRKGQTYQLWSVPVNRRSAEKMIFQVTDHDECGVIGDSIDWHPVTFMAGNEVKWVYAIKTVGSVDPASLTKPAKSLLIDVAKKSLIKSENTTLGCSF